MADEKIKVTFVSVIFNRNAKLPPSGRVTYRATLNGRVVSGGVLAKPRKVRQGGEHKLDVSGEVDVKGKDELVIALHCMDSRRGFATGGIIGLAQERLKYPFEQDKSELALDVKGNFVLEYAVELFADGRFGWHNPKTVFAARQHTGSVTVNTVSGKPIQLRMEFHPVRPTPSPASQLPKRPPSMRRARDVSTNGTRIRNIRSNSPLNVIPNPSVIPILDPSKDNLTRMAARIEYTWYHPWSKFEFKDTDTRLEWWAVPLVGQPTVTFDGGKYGTKVRAYATGDTEGEVMLYVFFKGSQVGVYRALVKKIKKVSCRFNILKNKDHPPDSPNVSVAKIKEHLAIANRFLYQAGIMLELDPDSTTTDGATRLDKGIFKIEVPAGYTKAVPRGVSGTIARLNLRPKVMNFVYIRSYFKGILGQARWRPASTLGAKVVDSSILSTSWKYRSGVQYVAGDGLPRCDDVPMNLLPGKQPKDKSDVYAMFLTDRNSSATQFANTIAHEFGHILNLAHRNSPGAKGGKTGHDGVGHPPLQNLMHFGHSFRHAQDLDIIQTKAMHASPLFTKTKK